MTYNPKKKLLPDPLQDNRDVWYISDEEFWVSPLTGHRYKKSEVEEQ